MKLLLTAFDPFGGEKTNPAQTAVSMIAERIGALDIVKLTVPTVFGEAARFVIEAIRREKPDAVLCIGQAGGRAAVTPERIAINLMDARIADNAGNQPADEPIDPSAPAAYFSTLPIKNMVEAIRACGIPAEISNTAGTFVCNNLMYAVLHELSGNSAIGGFMHVPFLPEQAAGKNPVLPSMSLTDIACAIEAAIMTIHEALTAKIMRERTFNSIDELIDLVRQGGEVELCFGKTLYNILPDHEHENKVLIGIGREFPVDELNAASIEGTKIIDLLQANGAVYNYDNNEHPIHSIDELLKAFSHNEDGYAKICCIEDADILIMRGHAIPGAESCNQRLKRARVFKWREQLISDIGAFPVDGKPLTEILGDSEVLFRPD